MPAWLLLVTGLVLLYFGAEWLIRGSASLAFRIGLSPLVIGLTIVGFGTSSPELLVSVRATLTNSPGMALGNVIGSNICNIALILGLSALIRPLKINSQLLKFDIPVMIGCSLLLMAVLYDKVVTRIEGVLLFCGVLSYVGYNFYYAHRNRASSEPDSGGNDRKPVNVFSSLLLFSAGLTMLIYGARLFVDGAVVLAEALSVSKAVIGLTIVAVGTSLPELATSVVASIKKEGDISTGNIVGSNIFNILCILGVTAIVHPLNSEAISPVDVFVMAGLALLTYPLLKSDLTISRVEGLVFLAIYAGYTIYLF